MIVVIYTLARLALAAAAVIAARRVWPRARLEAGILGFLALYQVLVVISRQVYMPLLFFPDNYPFGVLLLICAVLTSQRGLPRTVYVLGALMQMYMLIALTFTAGMFAVATLTH